MEDIDNEYWEHSDTLAAWPTQFAIDNGCIYPYDWNKYSEDGKFSNHEDHGEEFRPYTGAHRWWLRTMSEFGETSNYACDIEPVGAHDFCGIVSDETGVRPVIRIKVTK